MPFLTLVFVVELFGAIDLASMAFATNVAAGLGGLAFLVAGFGLANVLRRRPFGALPTASAASSWRCS